MYQRTDNTGNTFRTVEFPTDIGTFAAIERNQVNEPNEFFPIENIMTLEEAIAKINFFCRFAQ